MFVEERKYRLRWNLSQNLYKKENQLKAHLHINTIAQAVHWVVCFSSFYIQMHVCV